MPKRHHSLPSQAAGTVRIIGGRWRGRKIAFDDAPGLRPTGDRLRETLFNWLAPSIAGAHCLDLFAGSGVLGFEALSRGAAHCLLVDRSAAVCRRLGTEASKLGATTAEVVCASGIDLLAQTTDPPFDVVFLDPPFHSGLLTQVLPALAVSGRLTTKARIYVEYPGASEPIFPADWELLRQCRAGEAGYALLAAPAS